MTSKKHLIIMAAGTGGHIIPGIAVAQEMQSRGWTVSWLGTTHGMENKLVPPTGIPMDTITFSGLRGKGLLHTAIGALRLVAAFKRCFSILRHRRADVVLGMGGYVCFPGGLMAALLRKPLMLVNADAKLLMSNQALLSRAQKIAFGFDGPAVQGMAHAVVTGNPVRAEIEAVSAPALRYANRSGPLRVLALGGSLGAQVLNECLPRALALMEVGQRPVLTHQTGAAHHTVVQAAYAQAQVQADLRPFIDDMAQQLATCDVVICRAGAITVSELCAAGVPSVLVPLVVSTTSHQRDNAQWMASQGAAIHLPQTELTPKTLADLLTSLTREALLTMAQNARVLAKPQAAQRVASEIERLVVA